MFDRVERVMVEAVGCLRPELVSARDAQRAVEQLTRVRKLVDGALVLLAARAADSGAWKLTSARSPEDWLATQAGSTIGEAHDLIATSVRLESLPSTAAAVRAGELSAAQASAVTDAAVADVGAEARMLEQARHDSLRNLRSARDEVKAAARQDDEARRAHWHRTRALHLGRDGDGAGTGRWRLPPELHAEMVSVLRPLADRAFDEARRAGERDQPAAYQADALVAMARAAAGVSRVEEGGDHGQRRPVPSVGKLIARVDHAALMRGHTEAGELCDITGIGPVPVSVVRDIVASGDVFLAAVVTKGVDVASVAHMGRRPNARQLTALQWRDPRCRIEGCPRPVQEWDHHEDWARTHVTRLPALGGLCAHHHDEKTYGGRHLVAGAIPGKLRLAESARAGPAP